MGSWVDVLLLHSLFNFYNLESDDDENIKPQRFSASLLFASSIYVYYSKQSKQAAASRHITTNGHEGKAPKKKIIDSPADYFGSAPIKRSDKPQKIPLRKVTSYMHFAFHRL